VRVIEVRGTVEVAAQERFSGEGEGQESEEDADLPRDVRDKAPRQPDARDRRGRPDQPEREDGEVQIVIPAEILATSFHRLSYKPKARTRSR